MNTPLLSVARVDKRFGATQVLSDIGLELQRGEFVCLLGPSGCGKSTLLNLVAGFETPSAGRILLNGRPVSGPGAERGMVFQEYALMPWLSVRDNIVMGPRARGASRAECDAICAQMLALTGLEAHAARFPRELSGGMKQRTAIARTLANRPALMLMDEPFGALDAHTREGLQEQLIHIAQATQATVLFVTHSAREAARLGDRVVLLTGAPGRITAIIDNPRACRRAIDEVERQIVAGMQP